MLLWLSLESAMLTNCWTCASYVTALVALTTIAATAPSTAARASSHQARRSVVST